MNLYLIFPEPWNVGLLYDIIKAQLPQGGIYMTKRMIMILLISFIAIAFALTPKLYAG